MASILDIGLTGMNAAQAGMLTTSHNISNVNTAGYSRQEVVTGTQNAQATGGGFIGQGASVETVKRLYSQFLENQVLSAQTQSSQFDTQQTQLQQVDNLFADTTSGISPALQQFFQDMQSVATDPQSIPARQSLLSDANAMVSRFHTTDGVLNNIRQNLNGQLSSAVDTINNLATQVAKLNDQIVQAQGTTGQPPNDLLDQRDQLIEQLNQQARVSVVRQNDGNYDLFIGSGQALVVGNQAMALKTVPKANDPQDLTIAYSNSSVPLSESSIDGGVLGGLLAFRNQNLDPTQQQLGRIAIQMGATFNAQHVQGLDMQNNPGSAFFSLPTPTVTAASGNSAGSGLSVSFAGSGDLTTSDYSLTYTNSGSSPTYTLKNLSSGQSQSFTSLPQTVDGLTFNMTGAMQNGDSFTIQPNVQNGASTIGVAITDPAKIAAAGNDGPVSTSASITNTGNATIGPATSASAITSPITLTYDQSTNQFTVSGATPSVSPITYTSGNAITVNGISFTISGMPQTGDQFTLSPNTGNTGDNRNALLLAGLQTQKTMDNGTASFQDVFGQLVSQVGSQTRSAEINNTAQQSILTQAKQSQQELSGVNLDEEAANLLRYQQAYQASGKVMQIASTLFQTVLQITGS